MKIRNGYVSNSSSSSFLLIESKNILIDELGLNSNKKYFMIGECGHSGDCATDVVLLNKKMIEFLKKNKLYLCKYKINKFIECSDYANFKYDKNKSEIIKFNKYYKEMNNKKKGIICFEADYSPSKNVKDLHDYYFDNSEKKIINKINKLKSYINFNMIYDKKEYFNFVIAWNDLLSFPENLTKEMLKEKGVCDIYNNFAYEPEHWITINKFRKMNPNKKFSVFSGKENDINLKKFIACCEESSNINIFYLINKESLNKERV